MLWLPISNATLIEHKMCLRYLLYLAHSVLRFSKLLFKYSVKLHPNYRTLKKKVAFHKQLSWLYLLSEGMSNDATLDNDEFQKNC